MYVKIINPLQVNKWDDIVLSCSGHSFFHSSAWAKVLSQAYNYTPIYFSVLDEKETAVLPMMELKRFAFGTKGVCLPFTDFCEPVSTCGTNIKELVNFAIEYGRKKKWENIEIRGGNAFDESVPCSDLYYHHSLDLTCGEDLLFSSFRNSTKRNIKKAVKEGVTVKILHTREALNEFYRLNCITRKHHGIPPQPKYFFNIFFENIILKKTGFIALGYYHDICIAGGVFLTFGNNMLYKYGASDLNFNHLRANYLVMWEAIKQYSQNGFKSISFGRTEKDNTGLMQYKDGWSTEKSIIKYYKYCYKKNMFEKEKKSLYKYYYTTIFKKTPIPLLRCVGSAFYKYIG